MSRIPPHLLSPRRARKRSIGRVPRLLRHRGLKRAAAPRCWWHRTPFCRWSGCQSVIFYLSITPIFLYLETNFESVFAEMTVTQDHRRMTYAKMKGLVSYLSGTFEFCHNLYLCNCRNIINLNYSRWLYSMKLVRFVTWAEVSRITPSFIT